MMYSYTKGELSQLMTLRKKDALDRLQEMNGTEAILVGLQTSPKTGLSDTEAELERRRTIFGRNHIESDPPKWFVALALEALSDKFLLTLIGAATLEIVLGLTVSEQKSTAWVEGAAILVAVAVVVLVTAFNEWTRERQFRGLQKRMASTQRYIYIYAHIVLFDTRPVTVCHVVRYFHIISRNVFRISKYLQ